MSFSKRLFICIFFALIPHSIGREVLAKGIEAMSCVDMAQVTWARPD